VFIIDPNYQKIIDLGFGAKILNPVLENDKSEIINESNNSNEVETIDSNKNNLQNINGSVENNINFVENTVNVIDNVEVKVDEDRNEENIENDTPPLLLLDEEAFYLFNNNYLSLLDLNECEVSKEQLWLTFVNKNSKFPIKYKVYEYFKEKKYA
jgi:tRNA splicing endonuclease